MSRPEAFVTGGFAMLIFGLGALAIPGLLALGVAAVGVAFVVYGLLHLRPGKEVWHADEFIAETDGETSAFRVRTPFVPGTLRVNVDGIAGRLESSNPSTGEFDLGWKPAQGDTVTGTWKEA